MHLHQYKPQKIKYLAIFERSLIILNPQHGNFIYCYARSEYLQEYYESSLQTPLLKVKVPKRTWMRGAQAINFFKDLW